MKTKPRRALTSPSARRSALAPEKSDPGTLSIACMVFIGGAIGAALRGLLTAIPPLNEVSSLITLTAVNTLGAFVLGMTTAFFARSIVIRRPRAILAPLVNTGILGGFTSFSSLAALAGERLTFTQTNGMPEAWAIVAAAGTAIAIMVLSLLLGFGAAYLGLRAGGKAFPIPSAEVVEVAEEVAE